jgi:Ulp1 family protease
MFYQQQALDLGRTNPSVFTGGWLIDSAIDAFLSILMEQHKCVHAVSSSAVQMMYNSINAPRVKIIQMDKEVNFIILPYNPRSVHWSLLIIDLKKSVMMHLDSLKGKKSPNCDYPTALHKAKIKTALKAWNGVDWLGGYVIPECSEQFDGINCGIFLLHFAELVAQGKPLTTACKTEEFRARVFKDLVEHKGNKLSALLLECKKYFEVK